MLRSVTGAYLPVLGVFYCNITLADKGFATCFHIIRNMKRNVILGCQFMSQYKVTLDLGTNTCHIADMSIPMSDLAQVRSYIRLVSDINIPPNHIVTTHGRYHKRADIPYNSAVCYHQVPGGFLDGEPGLAIMNGMTQASNQRKVP